ncbi:glycoside hydrolase [Chryseobacterium piperi]|uniref:Glycoside hydrolase n=1 Tax=Chryseobacterium piperi TaxID=558152 RepID=A0A086B9P1_9FLAO|nr:glycoside hydrolase family 2 TIM barrel-domain containing protein [Chryseobacterium piperi]ASW73596.1 glycoside hydrolase family 2 [Chryseobacterium piperi]KFF25655.1 glycoside hydrolase [Chryseobacterium piperi]
MRKLILAFFIAFLFHDLEGQQMLRLTQNWEYLKGDLGGIYEAVRPVKAGTPETVPIWKNVTLPHSFNATDAVDPDVNYYQGPGWYRTQLTIDNPYKNGRTLLHFEGAGQKTQVYIYDMKVAEHVGGYDEWIADITEAVEAFRKSPVFQKQFKGRIPVEIRCDNSRDLEMIPSNLSDFNIYGGLYRYLNLVYVPQVSAERVSALASVDAKGAQGKLKIGTKLLNPDGIDTILVKIEIKDAQGKLINSWNKEVKAFYGNKDLWETTIKNPKLWSPENPNLYTIETKITAKGETAIHQEKIGFRNFEFVKKGPFLLNGKRLLLRGTHRHEDHAGVAAAMTEDQIREEMILMKNMGVNFIRLGHYQQSRIILELCDSLGILVWEEIPWCRGGLGGESYKNQARTMLTNMIEQHDNHPSIIIWGMGNENDWPGDFNEFNQHKIREFMKELNDLSHHLDPSRKTAIRRCDFCKDIVDIYSPSIWAGWYRGVYTEYKEASRQEFEKVDRFLHAEWGGDNHAGRHSENPDNALSKIKMGKGTDERAGDASLFGGSARVSKDGDWSESYMVNLIDWHLKEQETMPWLTGAAYWPFKDFSTPVRPDNPIPYVNQKGVIERDFTKKEAYYVFQSYWTKEPMVHIYGHSWPVRWGDVDEQKMIKVYANLDEVELFLNGKSLGKKKRNSQDFPAAGLRWIAPFVQGNNTIKAIGKKDGKLLSDEIIQEYQTAKWDQPAKMILEKVSEKDDITLIRVRILDKNNILCLDAKNIVTFGLTGDGELIDDLGTARGSRKVQAGNGRAEISIKLNKGKSVASVKADGLASAFIEL